LVFSLPPATVSFLMRASDWLGKAASVLLIGSTPPLEKRVAARELWQFLVPQRHVLAANLLGAQGTSASL